MTREIEYRQFINGKMVYSGFERCGSFVMPNVNISIYPIMQYTGTKDRNGVKCFYDDVVKINLGGEYYQFVVANVDGNTVILDMHNNGAVYDFLVVYEKEFEIIGNIHEDKK